jgi:peroxiredoxin
MHAFPFPDPEASPMKFTGSLLAVVIAASTTVGDGVERTSRPVDSLSRPSRLGTAVTEMPYAQLQAGDRAPDFSWVGVDNQTRRLRDVLDQANALIVFAPSDEVMQSLERERDEMAQIAVVPVVVIDARAKSAFNRARKAGVHLLVVPDPQHVIGAQFNLLEPQTLRLLPGWYAIDRRGVVRGIGTEPKADVPWTRLAASALAIPAPDVPMPAKTR